MSLVLDASIVLAWSMPDEDSELATRALDFVADSSGNTPDFFGLEIANVLGIAIRRNRIALNKAKEILEDIGDLKIYWDVVEKSRMWTDVFELSYKHQLSAYDASYLELASRMKLPLATLDKKLAAAAQAEGVAVFGQDAA